MQMTLTVLANFIRNIAAIRYITRNSAGITGSWKNSMMQSIWIYVPGKMKKLQLLAVDEPNGIHIWHTKTSVLTAAGRYHPAIAVSHGNAVPTKRVTSCASKKNTP